MQLKNITFLIIQIPFNYYFKSSKSIKHILYKNKIEQYTLENDVELISLIDKRGINYSINPKLI